MGDVQETRVKWVKGFKPRPIKWFGSAEVSTSIPEHYIDALAHAPRKVDILIRVDGTPGMVQADLLEQLARHPKVGTIIIYGLPPAQRIPLAALVAQRGIHIRFCECEDDVRVLLCKRRSRVIAGSMPDALLVGRHEGVTGIHLQ